MEIPLNAPVECSDGICGHSVFVLVNPVIDQVTHLVVKMDDSPNTEYIVPMDCMFETITDTIRLRCSKADLEKMEPFIQTTFIQEKVPDRYALHGAGVTGMGSFYYMPYVTPEITVYETREDQQIPSGELAIRRGTRVQATDGYVGHVDEFVVDPQDSHITHLVMREGHLWGKKDVMIPIIATGNTRDDTVFLKIDKHQIEALPTFPVHRLWA